MRWLWSSLFIAAVTLAGLGTASADPGDKKVDLLAGNSLAGWDVFLVNSKVKKEDVWSLKDGVLVCKGEPLGYLYTKKQFQNFKLTLQWRWAPARSRATAACCCGSRARRFRSYPSASSRS